MAWNRTLIVGLTTALAWTSAQLWIARSDPRAEFVPRNLDYAIEKALAERAEEWLAESGRVPQDDVFVRAVARLRPSVVSISVLPDGGDAASGERSSAELEQWGTRAGLDRWISGTGIVIDRQGHILTNLHVVNAALAIEVQLSSGERYRGTVIGEDPLTDLAVVHIEAIEDLLPVAWLGEDEELAVGQQVLAVGNAYGLGWSVTHGIISSLHRRGERDQWSYSDYIQTDAAINPGNSGGPLVNCRGEIVGINSLIVSERGESAGIGLALPAADARFVAEELVTKRRVERGFLGLRARALVDLSRRDRERLGLETARGVLVTSITKGRTADEAGVRVDDVILEIDSEPVESFTALRSRIARTKIGRSVELKIQRGSKALLIPVQVGRYPGPGEPLTRND